MTEQVEEGFTKQALNSGHEEGSTEERRDFQKPGRVSIGTNIKGE